MVIRSGQYFGSSRNFARHACTFPLPGKFVKCILYRVGIKEDDKQNDDCLDDQDDLGWDAKGVNGRRHGLNEERTQHGSCQREAAAGHECAADHDCKNCVQLHKETYIVGIGALDVRTDDQAGDSSAE